MRIFNANKTQELNGEILDYTKGHLVNDKLFIAHHDAVPAIPAKSVADLEKEYASQGKQVVEINGTKYVVLAVYEKGRHLEKLKPQPEIPAIEAYDEEEDIYVYKLYTEAELLENKKNELRAWRETYFAIIDRPLWFMDDLTDDEKAEVRAFRQELKDITKTLKKPIIPACVLAEIKE